MPFWGKMNPFKQASPERTSHALPGGGEQAHDPFQPKQSGTAENDNDHTAATDTTPNANSGNVSGEDENMFMSMYKPAGAAPATPESPSSLKGKRSTSFLRGLSLSPKRKSEPSPSTKTEKENLPPSPATQGMGTPAKNAVLSSSTGSDGPEMGAGGESPSVERASRIMNQTFERSRAYNQSQSTTPPSSPPANLSSRTFFSNTPNATNTSTPAASRATGAAPTPISSANTPTPSNPTPIVPRSILRPPQTPGTGQSVRFNGRSAFRIISPNISVSSSTSSANVSLSLGLISDESTASLGLASRLGEVSGGWGEEGSGTMSLSRIEDLSVDRLLSMEQETLDTIDVTGAGTGFEREGTPVGFSPVGSATLAAGAVASPSGAALVIRGSPAQSSGAFSTPLALGRTGALASLVSTPAHANAASPRTPITPVSASSSRSGTLPPPQLTPQTAALFDLTPNTSLQLPLSSGSAGNSSNSDSLLQDPTLDFTNLNELDLSRALRSGGGAGLESADSSGEGAVVVPPFASVSPRVRGMQSPRVVLQEASAVSAMQQVEEVEEVGDEHPEEQANNSEPTNQVVGNVSTTRSEARSMIILDSPSIERSQAQESKPSNGNVNPHSSVQSFALLRLGEGESLVVANPTPSVHDSVHELADTSANRSTSAATSPAPTLLSAPQTPAPVLSRNASTLASTPARGMSRNGSPLASTPDVTAYLSVAEWTGELPSPLRGSPASASHQPEQETGEVPSPFLSSAQRFQAQGEDGDSPLLRRQASFQGLGLGRQPPRSPHSPETSRVGHVEGFEPILDESLRGGLDGTRVFSRTAQPMQGVIAAVSTAREFTTPSPEKSLALPGKFRLAWDNVSPSASVLSNSENERPQGGSVYNTTAGEQSLMLPGKFRWDKYSPPGTPSPAPLSLRGRNPSGSSEGSSFTAISSLDLRSSTTQEDAVFRAHEEVSQRVRESNASLLVDQLREGQEEREKIRDAVGELVRDLRMIVDKSETASVRNVTLGQSLSVGEGEEQERLRREVEELKRALSEAENLAREEAASRIVLEMERQEVQLRGERERQKLEREVQEVREAVEEMKEAKASAEHQLEELRESLKEKDDDAERRREVEELTDMVQAREDEIEALKEELAAAAEREKELRDSTPRASPNLSASASQDLKAQLSTKDKHLTELQAELVDLKREFREQANALTSAKQKAAMLDAEVKAQWEGAEKATDKIQQLERDKKAILADLQRFQGERHERETQMREQKHELAAKLSEAWAARLKLENEKDEVATALGAAQEELEAVKAELAQLHGEYEEEHHEYENVRHAYDALQDASQAVIQEREEATEARERLEELVREQDKDLASTTLRIMEGEKENDTLRGEMAQVKRDYERELAIQARKLDEATRRAEEAEQAKNDLIRRKAMEEIDNDGWKSQIQVLKDENDTMRKQLHDLQSHLRDKELEVDRLRKVRDETKEDKDGLNLALEAKQQELDLLKRKYGVKGVAGGNTPATNRVIRPASRESLPFSTPASRAPSRESITRRTTLGSVEPIGASALKAPPTAEASRLSRRSSILATPTPATSGGAALSKGQPSTIKPSLPGANRRTSMPTTLQRRVSSTGVPSRTGFQSSMRASSTALQSVEDKENEGPAEEEVLPKAARRRTMLAA